MGIFLPATRELGGLRTVFQPLHGFGQARARAPVSPSTATDVVKLLKQPLPLLQEEKKGPEKPSEHTETTFCEPDPPLPLPPKVFHPNALNPSAWQGVVLLAESQPLQPMQVPGKGL